MGQQQLLLVILVTIIVGIATVVAINTFGSAANQANIDAVNNDIATLASAAQGYFMRPQMLGGGGRSFVGLTFDGLAFPATYQDETVAVNENGRYELTDVLAGSFTIQAFPASSDGYVAGANPITDPSTGGVALNAGVGPNTFILGATGADINSVE